MPEVKVDGVKVEATVDGKTKKEEGFLKKVVKNGLLIGGAVVGGAIAIAGVAKCVVTLLDAFEQRPEMPADEKTSESEEATELEHD